MENVRAGRRADACETQLRYAGLVLLSLPAIPLFIWGAAEIAMTIGRLLPL